jgi:hypothetical protein
MVRHTLEEVPDWGAIEFAHRRARDLMLLGRRRSDPDLIRLAEAVVDPLEYVMRSRRPSYRYRRSRQQQQVFSSDRGKVVAMDEPVAEEPEVDAKED